jgi:hypothetical protein
MAIDVIGIAQAELGLYKPSKKGTTPVVPPSLVQEWTELSPRESHAVRVELQYDTPNRENNA